MQCKAKTNWLNEEQCSRAGKVEIDGVAYCIIHAQKICLQRAIKDGIVKPIDPNDWFYKKIVDRPVNIIG